MSIYRQTSETLWVWFHTTAVKGLSQESKPHEFWFPSAYKSYAYTILWSIMSNTIRSRNNLTYLKDILANKMLSSESSVSCSITSRFLITITD